MFDYTKDPFVLVLSYRDLNHPKAGGAESYLDHVIQNMDRPIVMLTGLYEGAKTEETMHGYLCLRQGKMILSTLMHAIMFYRKNRSRVVLVLDHFSGRQFYTFLWARKKRVLLIHQMILDIWPYYYGWFGHVMAWFEERFIRLSRGKAIAVSPSTEKDLLDRGFTEVQMCPEGNELVMDHLSDLQSKEDYLLYVGRLLPYKRVEDVIVLGEKLNRPVKIIGRGPAKYIQKLIDLARNIHVDYEFTGYLSEDEKVDMMKKAYLLVLPSIREGWGLVITESANLGTPALVYPVHGVKDAVNYGHAGFMAEEVSVDAMAFEVINLSKERYQAVRENAFEYALQFTWEDTALAFRTIIDNWIIEFEKDTLK